MAKAKKDNVKVTKTKIKDKILKRKSAAITPKLKKLQGSEIKSMVKQEKLSKKSKLLISEPENQSEGLLSVSTFVFAPKNPINENQIESGVNALFEYVEKTIANKTDLFDEEEPVFLQITCIKVPKTPNRQVRFTLKNTLLTDESEICLIVKDVSERKKQHEDTIEHFEELLRAKGISNIKTIMPYNQFKNEYGTTFELKRKFLALYDCFLVDGRVSGYVAHLLGKIFLEKRKLPVPVKMDEANLKKHFDETIKKTAMKIHSKGDSFQVQVGHTKMTREKVFENILGILDELSAKFPGGLENVRALGIKTTKSLNVPIYLTLKNQNSVKIPIVVPKTPNAYKQLSGELTTYNNREVIVLPSGKVICHDIPASDDEELGSANEDFMLESDAELMNDEEGDFLTNGNSENEEFPAEENVNLEEKRSVKNKNKRKKENKVKTEVKIEQIKNEEEDILAQAEELYLNEYEEEYISTQKENKRKNKVEQKRSKRGNKKTESEDTEENSKSGDNIKANKKKIKERKPKGNQQNIDVLDKEVIKPTKKNLSNKAKVTGQSPEIEKIKTKQIKNEGKKRKEKKKVDENIADANGSSFVEHDEQENVKKIKENKSRKVKQKKITSATSLNGKIPVIPSNTKNKSKKINKISKEMQVIQENITGVKNKGKQKTAPTKRKLQDGVVESSPDKITKTEDINEQKTGKGKKSRKVNGENQDQEEGIEKSKDSKKVALKAKGKKGSPKQKVLKVKAKAKSSIKS